jgi:hypothetical protein
MTPVSLKSHYRVSGICYAATLVLLTSTGLAQNPVPTVTAPVNPQAVAPGRGTFVLTVYGANFISGAVVNWNRSPRKTTFVSTRELQAHILASDVSKSAVGYITVTNPAPGGGISSSSYGIVEVHKPQSDLRLQSPQYNGTPQQGEVLTLVAADFNGDGKLDLLDGSDEFVKSGAIRLWIGAGHGAFKRSVLASEYYFLGGEVAFGDFNNDGILDVIFSKGTDKNYPPTYAVVKLGNGKGGFKFGSQFGDFLYITQFAVGDFNRDGKLDVAVGDTNGAVVDVFLGNGDGTFTPNGDYSNGRLITAELATADFNGDGKLDVLVDSQEGLWLLIGNGDGTFQTPVQITPEGEGCAFGPPMLVNDFNGDGKFDIAFCSSSQIGILLGNGDGTFKNPVYYNVGKNGNFSFAAGDFYSNGKTDLIVSQDVGNFDFYILNGNGDGTFQNPKLVELPGGPQNGEDGILVGDFNADGLLDFILQGGGCCMTEYLQK